MALYILKYPMEKFVKCSISNPKEKKKKEKKLENNKTKCTKRSILELIVVFYSVR